MNVVVKKMNQAIMCCFVALMIGAVAVLRSRSVDVDVS